MRVDLAVIGAGPAGIAAATEARAHGLSVLVLDENHAPGGRIWQAIEARSAKDDDDRAAQEAVRAFRASGAEARFGATVWCVEPEGRVYWSEQGRARDAEAAQVLIATGATERPLPIPGWTLPGVMTVGAAQIALKTGGLVPSGDVWLAGQGPLLLLYATQALAAGGRIAGVLDLAPRGAWRRALAHLPGALRAPSYLARGLAWRLALRRAGVPWIRAAHVRAEGEGRLERIRFAAAGGIHVRPASLLLLHDGVIPSVQITRALGCAHLWDEGLRCWKPATDAWGRSSLARIVIAGDGAGIGGAAVAQLSGRIAALGIAAALGRLAEAARDAAAAPLIAARARHLAVRPFLDALFAPLAIEPEDDTILCRCEEVTAGRVREAVALGCLGANQLKSFTRAGMGPCQGRLCASTVAAVIAAARGVAVRDVEPYRLRFPTKPLTLGELAALHEQAEAVEPQAS
jgi:NADPH-dependent 2,4-dienoyl-CoA reductase/sulfur reductase-like enzyme